MGNPQISVIMLVYNRETFVRRSIESICSQNFQDFEFIIVNNGSTDGSGMIADEYAERDSRIRVIHREGGNIGSGRNCGLDLARGAYIAFVDDDDYAEPDFLEFLLRLAEKYNADIAVCGSFKEENGFRTANGIYSYDELFVLDAPQATEMYLRRKLYNAAMPTKLIRREMFDNIRFHDTGQYDDISTTYKYFTHARVVVAHGQPKYTFYRHPGNNSSAATKHHLLTPVQLSEYLEAFRERTEYIGNLWPKLRNLAVYSEWSYMLSMIEKIYRFELQGKCALPLNFMLSELREHYKAFYYGEYIQDYEKKWVEECIK